MERSSPCRFQVDLKGTSTETYSTNLDLQVLLKHLHQDIPPKKHNDAGRLMKNKRLTKLYVTLLVLLWDLTFAESSKDNTVMASPHSSINCMRSARLHTYKYRSKHQMRCCQSCMASSYLFLFRVWSSSSKTRCWIWWRCACKLGCGCNVKEVQRSTRHGCGWARKIGKLVGFREDNHVNRVRPDEEERVKNPKNWPKRLWPWQRHRLQHNKHHNVGHRYQKIYIE